VLIEKRSAVNAREAEQVRNLAQTPAARSHQYSRAVRSVLMNSGAGIRGRPLRRFWRRMVVTATGARSSRLHMERLR